MSHNVDELFEYLARDGRWHSLDELLKVSHLKDQIVEEIIQFFANYTFIKVDAVKNKIKIDYELRKIFLSSIQLENEAKARAILWS